MNLWDEVPEAKLFGKSIEDNIQSYKLYPTEEFADLWFGSLATSSLDLQGEAFTPKSLEAFVQRMKEEILWIGAHHDPLIQPYGRVISAKVFYAPKSQMAVPCCLMVRVVKTLLRSKIILVTEPTNLPTDNLALCVEERR